MSKSLKSAAPEDKLVLVRYKEGYKRQRLLIVIFTAVVFGSGGYWLGADQFDTKLRQTVDKLEQMSSLYQESKQNEESLRQRVTNFERGQAIDDLAKQEIQNTIAGLNATVSTLRKDVSFYKNIMAPSDNSKGLQVKNVEITPGQEPESYQYKVVLAQVSDNRNYIQGVVAINIIGSNGDKREVLPLRDISEEKELGIKFRFRYFQDIAGELVLPEGFSPESIQVVAQSKGKKASRIESSYSWNELLR